MILCLINDFTLLPHLQLKLDCQIYQQRPNVRDLFLSKRFLEAPRKQDARKALTSR